MEKRDRSIKRKSLLVFALATLLVLGATEALWAEYMPYNRPNAIMDYVPQEIGIYDTMYWELEHSDCRKCHGNSLADRHHLTDTVVIFRLCTPCHEVGPEPPFIIVTRDCLTSGCHSWDDLDTNGWHHNTDLSGSGNCTTCHDPNLIEEITPVRDFEAYPPSIVTPSPFSCENCHWGQDHWTSEDPDVPGHPSSYDHDDGFHEYSKPIYSNSHTHHMGFQGNVGSRCYQCHSHDPNYPDWDPYNPELIRYCETCHSADTLHSVSSHVQSTKGWEAVGFHVSLSNTQTRDVDPTVYGTWEADQMCFGCHREEIPDLPSSESCTGNAPAIDTTAEGIQPNSGTCGAVVALRGQNFGEDHTSDRDVEIRQKSGGSWIGSWTTVPIVSWTDTRIEFEITCDTLEVGNYKVRIVTECGNSNKVNFSLKDWISVTSISPETGECDQWITVLGDGFGEVRSKMFADGYNGVHRVVDFVSSQGTYTAKKYKNWTDTSIKVRFRNFFEDDIDPDTQERNFVQDDGSGSCAKEPTISACGGLASGAWSVYAVAVYFGDEDGSADLSPGDTIFQVVTSDSVSFELVEDEDPDPTEVAVESNDSADLNTPEVAVEFNDSADLNTPEVAVESNDSADLNTSDKVDGSSIGFDDHSSSASESGARTVASHSTETETEEEASGGCFIATTARETYLNGFFHLLTPRPLSPRSHERF